ncbi:MAG: QueT transporter family protein [Christensenellales bacterium]|jgi:uncharacterized membrane protein|nr:QueT transporter family protein [Clostridiales bacterium]
MNTKQKTIRFMARTAVIAALYALITIALPPLSYGPLQFRAAESLTLLPILFAEAIPGLSLGCLIANIFSPYGWYDMLFGTLATLIAACLTRAIAVNRKWFGKHSELMPVFAAFPPIFINALILPLMWYLFMGDKGYFINMWTILATQSAVIFILGLPLYYGIKKTGIHLK